LKRPSGKELEMDKSLDERLRFEELVIDLSARFVNLPGNEVETHIEKGLRRIIEFFNMDYGGMTLLDRKSREIMVKFSFSKTGYRIQSNLDIGSSFPWFAEVLNNGDTVILCRIPDDLPVGAVRERKYAQSVGLKSSLIIPIKVGGEILGEIALLSMTSYRDWPKEMITRLSVVGEIFANALARRQAEETLKNAFSEIEKLKDQLEAENIYLWQEIKLEHNFDLLLGESDALKETLFRVEQVAPTDSIVLILGETGTGKGLVARAIHSLSSRKSRPFITVNCAAFSPNLIESELFGREKGAYTGADSRQIGRFELANGGTIFLDEIGELPLELQPKLLRIIQDGEFERLGNPKTIKVDVRIIAATNRELKAEVQKGRFRQDLYYRVNVFPITVPSLRQRKEDIPTLVRYFAKKISDRYGRRITAIPRNVMRALQAHSWPGNVRELQNVVERAIITSQGTTLKLADKFESADPTEIEEGSLRSLAEIEREYIVCVLEKTNWVVEGAKGAAKILDLHPNTLRFRMKKLGIQK
jgi:formate hydrogenlyase transcriptional activator